MVNSKKKLRAPLLFLFIAISGIALFISAWNSYINGKEKYFLSLIFLILLLASLLSLYIYFNQLVSNYKPVNNSLKKDSENLSESPDIPGNENMSNKVPHSDILKSVFSNPDVRIIGEKILKNLAQEFEIVQGVFFVKKSESTKFTIAASYACIFDKPPPDFSSGEGITGQAVADNKIIFIPDLPESFSPVVSGLGEGKARYLYVIPLTHERNSIAVIEISCFKKIAENRLPILNYLMLEGGQKLNSLLFTDIK